MEDGGLVTLRGSIDFKEIAAACLFVHNASPLSFWSSGFYPVFFVLVRHSGVYWSVSNWLILLISGGFGRSILMIEVSDQAVVRWGIVEVSRRKTVCYRRHFDCLLSSKK